jgi:rhodanese-related sulfurtransferase
MPTDVRLTEVQRLLADGALLVEVLPPGEFQTEHPAGAINLPLRELTAQTAAAQLSRERPIVVYCQDAA